jgi:hypothetical protein
MCMHIVMSTFLRVPVLEYKAQNPSMLRQGHKKHKDASIRTSTRFGRADADADAHTCTHVEKCAYAHSSFDYHPQ